MTVRRVLVYLVLRLGERGASSYRADVYVPLSIRSRSRTVTWMWRRWPWLSYPAATRLARWLP